MANEIFGTPNPDFLNGTSGDDYIEGQGGNDNLQGNAGNDTLDGGSGNDFMNAGTGDDSLFGGTGSDLLMPGTGTDTVDGGEIFDRTNYTDGNTVSYSDLTGGVVVDLAAGTGAEVGGSTDTLMNISFVVGSQGNDTLRGTTEANLFEMFEGGAGNDSIDGGAIDPVLQANGNRANYTNAPGSVNVNLATGVALDGYGTQDTLVNINQVRGGASADTLTGSDRTDVTESFEGRAGNDSINGMGGFDQARYDSAGSGINVNLATGVALDGSGGTDTLVGIEGVRGGNFGDVLTGSDTSALAGIPGDFEFFTGQGGNDTIDGGGGYDRADYNTATSGVNVTLGGTADGSAQDGLGGTDILRNIEAVRGGDFNDVLTGSDRTDLAESLEGRAGNDILDGKAGLDRADYLWSPGAVNVHVGFGLANDGWGGTDSLRNIEQVRGSHFADTLNGRFNADDTIEGGRGDDTVRGNGGNDTYVYLAGSDSGKDLIIDFGPGDIIEVRGATLTAGSLTVTSDVGVTTLTIALAAGPGVVVQLAGTYAAADFAVNGSQITFSGTAGSATPVTGSGAITGGAWNDNLTGGSGSDTITGNNGNDTLNGGAGTDSLVGGAGSDLFIGGAGADTLVGGAITDRTNYTDLNTVSYQSETVGVSVNLQTGTAVDGSGATDTLSDINFVKGGSGNDTLTGSNTFNLFEEFEGFAGNDTIDGGAVDLLTGSNSNRVSYQSATSAVNVDLGAGIASSDGYGGQDTLINISNVRGGTVADTLTGSNRTDLTESFDGRGGNDTIDGMGGTDMIRFDGATTGVTVTFTSATGGTATDGQGGTDTFTGIEGVRGNNGADVFTGSDTTGTGNDFQFFLGQGGNDTIDGGAGFDRVDYNTASYGVNVTLNATGDGSAVDGQGGVDVLRNIEGVRGGDFADILTGTNRTDVTETFEGRGGNDTIDGMGGADRVDYAFDLAGVEVDLAFGTALDGAGGRDRLFNIEHVRGSNFADDIIGSSANNALSGNAGDDVLEGLGGNDTLTGGAGIDEFMLQAFNGDSDLITDLQAGERIVLGVDEELDAVFLTGTDPSGLRSGQVMFAPVAAGVTQVFVGADGAPGADLGFRLTGTFLANDFVWAPSEFDDGSTLLYRPQGVTLPGSAGADMLSGSNYADSITGQDGNDTLLGYAGNDTMSGGNGDDEFLGDAGVDAIDGGAGFDRVHYDLPGAMTAGVNANLATQTATSGGETDTFTSIEGVTGSDFNDTLVGSLGANIIWGADGDDLILGQPTTGNAAGAAYQGTATGGDTLTGEDGNDTIQGGSANDTLYGGTNDFDGPFPPFSGDDTFVFNASGNGVDFIADFDAEDFIRVGATLSTTAPTAGNGSALTAGQVQAQVSSGAAGSVTSLFIGTNGTAGADIQIQLAGSFEASGFVVTNNAGGTSSIRYVYPPMTLTGTSANDTLTGGKGNDTISGLGNNDSLSGGAGDDSLLGGDGWDSLEGGPGNDVLDGGTGEDTAIYWNAQGPMLVDLAAGTASGEGQGTDTLVSIESASTSWNNDTLIGDGASNNLFGNSGNDSISGGGGADILQGGWNSDTLSGGAGADLFVVQDGAFGDVDRILDLEVGDALLASFGQGSTTLLDGAQASTLLNGQMVLGVAAGGVTRLHVGLDNVAGADRFVDLVGDFTFADFFKTSHFQAGPMGWFGDIYVYDPSANLPKNLVGTDGFDSLEGGNANDTLSGLGSSDNLYGNGGDDSLLGGAGYDNLFGGAGNDTLDGGADWDTAAYWNTNTSMVIDLSAGTANGGEGSDVLISIESVSAGGNNDTLIGNDSANQLQGNWGNDSVSGGGGDDIVEGGPGNDTLTGGAGNDLFGLQEGNTNDVDRITDLQAGDGLFLNWSSGATTLLDGTNASGLLAGQMVLGTPVAGVTRLSIGMDSVAGADRFVDLVGEFTAGSFLRTNSYSTEGFGRFGDIYVYDPTAGTPKNLTGTEGSDTLVGGNANDTLSGLGSYDELRGNGGDDSLLGGADNDVLIGGAGNDTLDGGAGWDSARYSHLSTAITINLAAGTASGEGTDSLVGIEQVEAGSGNDTLTGDANGNQLFGNWGNDVLSGGGGDDALQGGWGNDTLTGGAGVDVFDLQDGGMGDIDRVTDLQAGDALMLSWSSTGSTLLGAGNAADLLNGQIQVGTPSGGVTRLSIGMDNTAGADRYVDLVGDFTADLFVKVDQLQTSSFMRFGGIYLFDATANQPKNLVGTEGNDTLNGGNANDTLSGLGGWDTLNGNGGDDSLLGGAGMDQLFGGAGNDTLNGGDEWDTAVYWNATNALVLDLSTGTATGEGTDLLVNIEALNGGNGNDTLIGDASGNYLGANGGNDSISGGAGADHMDGGWGSDTLTGGADIDLFNLAFGMNGDVDRITDLQLGEYVNVAFSNTTVLASGNADALTAGQLLFGAPVDNVTRLYIGTDQNAGWDRAIDLVGSFTANDFVKMNFVPSFGVSGEIYQYNTLPVVNGTSGNDSLTGSAAAERIIGLEGDDTINAGDGNDVISGGAGNDNINLDDGADAVDAGDGNDFIQAGGYSGAGADTIDGGAGNDVVGYGMGPQSNGVNFVAAELTPGVTVFQFDPAQGSYDTLRNIEEIHAYGTNFADTFVGNNQRNYFEGWDGNDTLTGNGGNDTFSYDLAANRGVDRITDLSNGDDLSFRGATLSGPILSGDNTGAMPAGRVMIGAPTLIDGVTVTRVYVSAPAGIQEIQLVGSYSAANFSFFSGPFGTSVSYAAPLALTGTSGPDLLDGANAADTIDGLAGNDTLNGMDGNDVLSGGAGDDHIDIGGGADSVNAGDGNDFISAGGWNSAGADTIDGGAGFDVVGFGFGNLQQGATFTAPEFGLPGTSVQVTDPSDGSVDTLTNIEGIDAYGSEFADTFVGNSGHNFFDGWGGNDTLTGNGGDDSFGYDANRASGLDRITDFNSGDNLWFNALAISGPVLAGDDTSGLQAGRVMVGATVLLGGAAGPSVPVTRVYVGTNVGVQTIELQGTFDFRDFSIFASPQGSSVNYSAPMALTGTAGNDTLNGGGSRDTISGLDGDDLLFGNDGDDVISGGAGRDNINLGGGADSVTGGDGDDYIRADGGNGAGADTIDGGAGYDTFSYGFSNAQQGITFTAVELGAAGSTVQQLDPSDGNTDSLTNIEEIQASGGSFSDTLVGNSTRNFLEGWGGNDTLTGNGGNDTFAWDFSQGGQGVDRVTDFNAGDSLHFRWFTITLPILSGDDPSSLGVGRVMVGTPGLIDGVTVTKLFVGTNFGLQEIQLKGSISATYFSLFSDPNGHSNLNYNAPSIVGTPGDDLNLSGTAGNDTADLLAGNDSLDGGAGNDSIRGGAGNDTLLGGAGFDTLVGEDGNDSLDGGTEDDTLVGGAGNDTLQGSTGFDTANYAYLSNANGYVIDAGGASVTVRGRGDNAAYFESDAINSFDVFVASAFDDTLRDTASNRETYLMGGTGNDTIVGSAYDYYYDHVTYWDRGNNQYVDLNFATGVSQVKSSADNAVLETDTVMSLKGVFGTAGNDSFVGSAKDEYFRGGLGNDTIDGAGGSDSVSFNNASNAITVTLLDGGAEIVVADGTGGSDTLRNIENLHGTSAADVLTGNSSNNNLRGNGGNDTIDGAGGMDVAQFRNGAVNIQLAAAGTDTLAKDGVFIAGVEGTDTLRNIEGLSGSTANDTLGGNEVDNYFWGNNGNDLLIGGAGRDTLDGGSDFDTASYRYLANTSGYTFTKSSWQGLGGTEVTMLVTGRGANAAYTETDVIWWMERFTGSDFNDEMVDVRASYNTWFQAGLGNDTLRGNAGDVDFADYGDHDNTYSVVASLATGVVTVSKDGGVVETDQLFDIHGFWGSAGNDSVVGSDLPDVEFFRGQGGNDTIDGAGGTRDIAEFRNATAGVTITLAASGDTVVSDGQGGTDTLRNIEGLAGSGFNDSLTGNAGDNILIGRGGNDTLTGGAGMDLAAYINAGSGVNITLDDSGNASNVADGEGGSDSLVGFEGLIGSDSGDTLNGNSGINLLSGEDGNDNLSGRGGNDTLTGGFGFDTFDYGYLANASGANGYNFAVNATSVVVTGRGTNAAYTETDQIDQVELLVGSAGDDVLTDNTVGRETYFRGGLGNDTITGQLTENDFAVYNERSVGIVADLAQQTVTIGTEVDTLVGIRGVWGGSGNDVLTGSGDVNIFRGRGGNDSIDGAGGTDYVDYNNALQGIVVNMAAAGTAFTIGDGEGGVDTVVNIEGVFATNHDDVLVGNAGDNIFRGRNGWDFIDGGAGRDMADYANARYGVRITLAAAGQETLVADDGENGSDRLLNIEGLAGTAWGDVLTGNEADNTLRGRAGSDTLSGGAGFDIAEYQGSSGSMVSTGVTITLAETGATLAQDGMGGTDTLTDIEGLSGTSFSDTLTGNSLANLLVGNQGNDVLNGGGGNDTLRGGQGNDTLSGGNGADQFVFGARGDGVDRITDFATGDTIKVSALLGAVSAGDGSGVTGGAVQVQTGISTTSLFIDTDNVAGADLQIDLQNAFQAAGFSVATGADGTSQLSYVAPEGREAHLDGMAYYWKSHMLLGNVGVEATTNPAVIAASTSLFDLRGLLYNAADNSVTAQVWVNPTAATANFGFSVTTPGATGVSFTSALAADWMIETGSEATGNLNVSGITAGAGVSTAAQVGTVKILLGAGQSAATVNFSGLEVGNTAVADISMDLATRTTAGDGQFHFTLQQGAYGVSATRSATDIGTAISSADALAALKLVVGANPNDPDGAGPLTGLKVSPYQIIASDANEDGKLTSADALAILRMVVKGAGAPVAKWTFVNETLDLWNEAAAGGGASLLTRNDVKWNLVNESGSVNLQSDTVMNLVGVLRGDVNGNWSAPAGSTDLDNTQAGYFQALATQLGVPTDIWGI